MGGTLPAAAREVEGLGDARRRATAFLYGANTLGAVTGAGVATFYGFERLGNRGTLFAACALNLAVALVAWLLSRRSEPAADAASEEQAPPAGLVAPPRRFVLAACGIVGFACCRRTGEGGAGNSGTGEQGEGVCQWMESGLADELDAGGDLV